MTEVKYVRRYMSQSKVSHAVRSEHGKHTPAACMRSPLWFDGYGWRGTAVDEIDRNKANRQCKRCVTNVGSDW